MCEYILNVVTDVGVVCVLVSCVVVYFGSTKGVYDEELALRARRERHVDCGARRYREP